MAEVEKGGMKTWSDDMNLRRSKHAWIIKRQNLTYED